MGRRLNSFVHVADDEGGYVVFGPDDDVPAALAKKIGGHAWVDDDDDKPAKSASKSDWVAFAVSQGAEESEAEAMTKDELVKSFGE